MILKMIYLGKRVVLKAGMRKTESQVIVLPIQRVQTIKHSYKLTFRPNLIRPKASFYECFIVFTLCIGKTMTCDSGFQLLGQPWKKAKRPLSHSIS